MSTDHLVATEELESSLATYEIAVSTCCVAIFWSRQPDLNRASSQLKVRRPRPLDHGGLFWWCFLELNQGPEAL